MTKKDNSKLRKNITAEFKASMMLLFMFILYSLSLLKNDEIWKIIRAFSEAAMVGGLADWFAVVALFDHPLNIKFIPHTAIIPKNKEKIATNLAKFVKENFIRRELIENKFKTVDFTGNAIKWISTDNNLKWLINKFKNYSYLASDIIKDEDIKRFIFNASQNIIKNVNFSKLMARILKILQDNGFHFEVYDKISSRLPDSLKEYLEIKNNDYIDKFIYYIVNENNLNYIKNQIKKNISLISKIAEDNDLRKTLQKILESSLEKISLSKTLGKLLEILYRNKNHNDLFNEVIAYLPDLINENEDLINEEAKNIKNTFVENKSFWKRKIFNAIEYFSGDVSENFALTLKQKAQQIKNNNNHEIRKEFEVLIIKLINNLNNSRFFESSLRKYKHKFIKSNAFKSAVNEILEWSKSAILKDITDDRSVILFKSELLLKYSIEYLKSKDNKILYNKLNSWIEEFFSREYENVISFLRLPYDKTIEDFIIKLDNSEEYNKILNSRKYSLLNSEFLSNSVHSFWNWLRNIISQDILSEESNIFLSFYNFILMISETLKNEKNITLIDKANSWIVEGIVITVTSNKDEISEIVENEIKKWETKELTKKIKSEIGEDLQYIRINGTIMGGMIGLILYTIPQIMKNFLR
jgi:uncharacterized membrane-anchored protein YjiN (DUF445 family)